tara:strand:+ start:3759 stop:4499 length:741 start_codon:yes stop_codon:yes gene_type:complete
MTITQDGANNKITGSGGKAQVSGNNTSTTYAQTGDNNQVWAWMSSGNGINNVSQIGDNNSARLDCHGNNCVIDIEQNGNYNYANAELGNGGDNDQTIIIDQDGNYNFAKVEANGDDNTITVDQDGNNHIVHGYGNTPITGDRNNITLVQDGSQYNQAQAKVVGNDNTIDGYQGGQYNFGRLVLTGNDHDVTSSQEGTGTHSMTLDLTNGGGAYTVNTIQDSTTNQSYSLTGICTNTIGCAISVTQN